MNPDTAFLAYVAGLLDGEGCLTIGTKIDKGKTYYTIRVLIQMSEKAGPLLEELQNRLGGGLHLRKERAKTNQVRCMAWGIYGEKAISLLQLLLPFLAIKKPQALTLIQCWEAMPRHKEAKANRAEWEPIAAMCVQRIRTLNRVGIPPEDGCFALLVGNDWCKPQLSLFSKTGLEPFSESFPREGICVNGHVFRRQMWAPAIGVIGGGLLPTPVAQTGAGGPKGLDGGSGARQMLMDAGIPRAAGAPTALPTPRTCSAMAAPVNSSGSIEGDRFPNLETVIGRMLPTPTVNDSKNASLPPSQQNRDSLTGAMLRDDSIPTGAATYLNPSFVEEMMGFPVGWTA